MTGSQEVVGSNPIFSTPARQAQLEEMWLGIIREAGLHLH